ncbi:MAG: hypothetical protein R3314_14510, partial [Longimicrobiales bacterium]|nr:hypothetical protein [Longimicrobiales bacterium]
DVGQRAFRAAERGMQDLMGTKTRPYFEDSVGVVGAVDTLGPVTFQMGDLSAQYTVYVNRVATRLFMVESEGEILSGGKYAGAKRRIAELLRVAYTYVPKDRAMTTQDEVRIRGNSVVSGDDQVPAGWSDCTDTGTRTGVVSSDTTTIDVPPGGGPNSGVYGSPKYDENATLDSTAFTTYGDMHLDDLKEMAEKVYAPGTYNGMAPVSSGGTCDKSVKSNWGDPNNASGDCHLYWPIIYTPGNMNLGSGVGQGILVVDGDLHISGNFEFSGLVFVYGAFTTTGTGNKINGSVNILGNSTNSSQIQITGAGSTDVFLSSCAIERAHRYSERWARPIPLAERRFVDLTGLGVF